MKLNIAKCAFKAVNALKKNIDVKASIRLPLSFLVASRGGGVWLVEVRVWHNFKAGKLKAEISLTDKENSQNEAVADEFRIQSV